MDHRITDPFVADEINRLVTTLHSASDAAGWWTDGKMMVDLKYNPDLMRYVVPTKIALIHSEVSEALEGYRRSRMDDHLPDRSQIEVELADALIRICDLAGALNLDLGGAVVAKHNYNQTRPDHKPEARNAEGGKKI